MKSLFKGSGVAIITPFTNSGKIDYKSFEKLIEFQINNKTDAIIVLGTTGEAPTISKEERSNIIQFVVSKVNGRCKVIVGSGSNNTVEAIEKTLVCKKLGVDGVLVVTPYYNKCTQQGIIEHYKTIAQKCDMPIICYNVPSRTGVNINPDTAVKLSEIPQVYGIKEASGNISQIVELCDKLDGKMAVYSGDDLLNYVFMSLGASGVISVTANIFPKKVKEILTLCFDNFFDKARNKQRMLNKVNKALFYEVNPIPIKYALSYKGFCKNKVRLPLTKLSKRNAFKIRKVLKDFEEDIL